jgi:hypothetical protein
MSDTNFDVVDRLVQFGLGAGVAQHMVASMNSALQTMQMPGRQPMPGSAGPAWWIVFDDKPAGPFHEAQVLQLIAASKVTTASHVWRAGMARWQTVDQVPEMLRLVVLTPPPFHPEQ